ncbi:MAG: twin-arginine translocation signal domain-containing protein [Roseibacillus sp.]|nr:twin-arginine translocation signal domain-containing protein [Roseibacillus sp.]
MIPGAMNGFTNRRHLLQAGAAAGALGFLSKVPLVGAEEAKLDPEFV